MGKGKTQDDLLKDLNVLRKKLNNPNLKDRNRTKKNILRTLARNDFKKPYTFKWWRDFRSEQLQQLFPKGFICPQCGSSEKPTLQHTWHPKPFRVLCSETVDEKKFLKAIPKYLQVQEKKRALCEQEYRNWYYGLRKKIGDLTFKEQHLIEYGYDKAKSRFALAYFSSDEILHTHINEVERYIRLNSDDYKWVCHKCAAEEDSAYIETGRLYPDIPYFLFDDGCKMRDRLAESLIERLLDNLV